MNTNAIEAKKDRLSQVQTGEWKLTLTIQATDMPLELMTDPMGTRYGMAFVKMDEAEEDRPKLAQRAALICKSTAFQDFCGAYDEDGAREYLLDKCQIESRRDFNTNKSAADKFMAIINEFEQHNKRRAF